MDGFLISAPGKIILFGEHAVVHGKTAIAAAVSLRTYTMVEESEDASRVELDFSDIKLEKSWAIADLPWHAVKKSSSNGVDKTLNEELVKALNETCLKDLTNTFQHAAALAFLYLYVSICNPRVRGYKLLTRSMLPVGAGLGSSAGLSVCLSAALLTISGTISDPSKLTPSSGEVDLINSWAFLGECCIHGNPSGVDNTVATRGGAVWYQRPNLMKPIGDFPPIKLVLTNTGHPRRTSELVANVGRLKQELPSIVNPMLDSIHHLAEEAYGILSRDSSSTGSISDKLAPLVHINHTLLNGLGVSHPTLESVKTAADELDLGPTKLTGAGGGGCAVTLVTCDTNSVAQKVQELSTKLPETFQVFETILGGPGVGLGQIPAGLTASKFNVMGREEFEKVGPWSYWNL